MNLQKDGTAKNKNQKKESLPAVPMIHQIRVADLLLREAELKDMRRKIKMLESELSTARLTIMSDYSSGMMVEPGRFTLGIEVREGASRPPWKDLYLDHMEEHHDLSKKQAENEARLAYPGETEKVLMIGVTP